ncbi:MAG TPA: energy-coupling factor transporter transmembrane protein EcfT [Desulfurococcales archaeon]|nr:energy-coupling factor transporter transmembrane protein EcfT [Desulfurococcales archaeon]
MAFASRLYTAFIYRREDKFLFKLNPLLKIVSLIPLSLIVTVLYSPISLTLYLAVILLLAYFLANLHRCVESVLTLKYFFIVIFTVIYVYTSYPQLVLNVYGLVYAYTTTLRFIILIILFSLFISTTNITDLAYALTKLGLPYEIAFTLALTVRFIPTIARDIQAVYDAQRSRGLELERGGFFRRLKNLSAILIPAFTTTLMRVDKVAEALESRAFGTVKKRTYLSSVNVGHQDILFLLFSIILVLAIYYLDVNMRLPTL